MHSIIQIFLLKRRKKERWKGGKKEGKKEGEKEGQKMEGQTSLFIPNKPNKVSVDPEVDLIDYFSAMVERQLGTPGCGKQQLQCCL